MDVLDYVVIVAIMIYARICSVVRYSNDVLAYMALTEGRALIPFPIASYICMAPKFLLVVNQYNYSYTANFVPAC